jgi:hypothetical protein
MKRHAAFAAAFSSVLVLLVACYDYPEAIPCGQIPPDGCPVTQGGTCNDPFCTALYECVDGVWRHWETCSNPQQDAGTTPDACSSIVIDRTGETTGCLPDLQNPDCPAAAAEQCITSVCQSECADFFLCTKEGWQVVAFCTDQGELIIMQ